MVTFLLMVNKHLVNTYYVPDLSLPWKYRTINPLPSLLALKVSQGIGNVRAKLYFTLLVQENQQGSVSGCHVNCGTLYQRLDFSYQEGNEKLSVVPLTSHFSALLS